MIFNIFNYKNIYEIVNYRKEIERFKKEILSCKDNLLLVAPEYNLCKNNTIVLSSSILVNNQKVKIIYSKKFSEVSYKARVYYLDTEEIALEIESTNLNYLIYSINLFLSLSCNFTSTVI